MNKKQILNYLVIIEPDKRTGTNKNCYTIYCPVLGLVDDGDTIEQAMENMRGLIKFHLKSLAEEGETIPIEKPEKGIIGNIQIPVPRQN